MDAAETTTLDMPVPVLEPIKGVKRAPLEEYFTSGHRTCQGCESALVMKLMVKAAGRYAGFQSGFAYWVSNWTGIVAISVAVTGYLTVFLPVLHEPVWAAASTIAVIWILTLINALGPRFTSKFSGSVLALGALPVLAVGLAGWAWFDPALFARNWNPSGKPLLEGVPASVLLIFWAFTGMESVPMPRRTISASSVWYSSKNGLSPPRPKIRRKSR